MGENVFNLNPISWMYTFRDYGDNLIIMINYDKKNSRLICIRKMSRLFIEADRQDFREYFH